jgi:hypothetical protein
VTDLAIRDSKLDIRAGSGRRRLLTLALLSPIAAVLVSCGSPGSRRVVARGSAEGSHWALVFDTSVSGGPCLDALVNGREVSGACGIGIAPGLDFPVASIADLSPSSQSLAYGLVRSADQAARLTTRLGGTRVVMTHTASGTSDKYWWLVLATTEGLPTVGEVRRS